MIPLYKPFIRKKELDALFRVLKSGRLSRGREVEKFEKAFALYMGQKYAIAVNSGTSGLHLAVRAMDWKSGDEIITTPFSYIASANSLLFEGVTPVFVDIDPVTLNIDVNKIEQKITSKTKGILLVHILGLPVDANKIRFLKKKYGLRIIEDACEAVGKPSNDFSVTKIGDVSVFGFHENKQITTCGEGGMITTNNHDLAKKCRAMRDQGRSLKKNWLKHVILGFNYRMTEVQAAFGNAQLQSITSILKERKKIAEKYTFFLKGIDKIKTPNTRNTNRSWLFYFIIFNKPSDRNFVHKTLSKSGISSSCNYFPTIYNFSIYSDYRRSCCKNSEYVSKRLLVLPMFSNMVDSQIKEVSNAIKKALK